MFEGNPPESTQPEESTSSSNIIDKLLPLTDFIEVWKAVPADVAEKLGGGLIGKTTFLTLIAKLPELPIGGAKFVQDTFEETVAQKALDRIFSDPQIPDVDKRKLPTAETLFEVALETGLIERDTMIETRFFIPAKLEEFIKRFAKQSGDLSAN